MKKTVTLLLNVLFVFLGLGFAQPPAASPSSQPVPAITKIMKVDDVRPGMKGVGYTVFQGTQPETMGVEVLGVLRNLNGPKSDVVLVKLTGEKAEFTGVVAGMSGSPVYIDGKLLGAIAYRIGQFSKEPIAGVTPIEQMLEINEFDHEYSAVRRSFGSATDGCFQNQHALAWLMPIQCRAMPSICSRLTLLSSSTDSAKKPLSNLRRGSPRPA